MNGHIETVRFILENDGAMDVNWWGKSGAMCLVLVVQRGFM